jgi:hypothetical protein
MTYGRVECPSTSDDIDGAAVSHSAELVRGDFLRCAAKAPHPPVA